MTREITCLCALFLLSVFSVAGQPSAVIRLTDKTLMHEVRESPSPADGEHISMNPPRFMWEDKYPYLGEVLDGVEVKEAKKRGVTYRIRISQDRDFKNVALSGEQPWAFFNPFQCLAQGEWFWQHAYVTPDGEEEWSPVLHFYVDEDVPPFNPPSYETIVEALPARHPRILLDADDWNSVIERNRDNPEARAYITKADECFSTPLKHLQDEIDTSNVVTLENAVQRKSALIVESRKIVDREEPNVEALVRAYLLTRDEKYSREGISRLTEILSWRDSEYLAGDFNLGTLLSLSTSVYDGFYNILTAEEKQLLTDNIREIGSRFYRNFANHLENRIADNHVWQMTFRILTMAAFATLGEVDEASLWSRYCYNEWVSRFPGLNDDGAWHNGDSYFHVNIRTLIEVPAFYSRISGFDFFADPWYNNNALYVIYQQPPFSKSGGFGNAHENQRSPSGPRVGYADALARECRNPWAMAYRQEILDEDPTLLAKSFGSKPGDLTWYRITTSKTLPDYAAKLSDLPGCEVFPQTGTALMHTDIGHYKTNAMLSFRSSPYGSTSHALANQNAFNTFYGGKAIFYSSGHRISFTDDHSMYAYRNTRAHNSILVNGMGQKIGTEGYGWIPRYYEGEKISYVVGDASNAYGQEESPLWLERGHLSGTLFTPENGWDENRLEFFRRHIVQLGHSGLFVVYDELIAKEPVEWNYLLHTTELPMEVTETKDGLEICGRNKAGGKSVAHLFSPVSLSYSQTDKFFFPAVDWKKGRTLPNHYHFTANTDPCLKTCFLNVVDVHGGNRNDAVVERNGDKITVEGWIIKCNLKKGEEPYLHIENKEEGIVLDFNYQTAGGATIITDIVGGEPVRVTLVDSVPELEI